MHTIRSFLDLPRVNKQFEWNVNAIITMPTQNPAKWKDFIAYTIQNEFLNSDDALLNMNYMISHLVLYIDFQTNLFLYHLLLYI